MRLKQSSLDLYSFVSVYSSEIAGSFIKKIHQVGAKSFIFQIYRSDTKRRNLYVSLERGVAVMDADQGREPGMLALTLRKMLSERKIEEIRQHSFDRVLILKLYGGQQLILEMFREGNLIITQDQVITFVLNPREWKNRKLIKGEKYVPPVSINPFELTSEDASAILSGSTGTIVQTIATRMNTGGDLAEEICFRIGVGKDIKAVDVSDRAVEILRSFHEIADEAGAGRAYYYDEEQVLSPVTMRSLRKDPDRIFDDLGEGLSFYFAKYPETTMQEKPLARRIESQRRSIEEFMRHSAVMKALGQEIISQLPYYGGMLKALREGIKSGTLKPGETIDGMPIKSIDYDHGKVYLQKGEAELPLNVARTAGENASDLFSISKEYVEKAHGAEVALVESERLLEHSEKQARPKRRQKNWFEVYHWYMTADGQLVLAGRDRKTNENLVKKHLEHNDLYVHADLYGAPSTVVKRSTSGEINEESVRQVCTFAISFSRAWAAGIASGSAYWVFPEQVSKTAESGEYVSKGAWIIRGKRNYVFNLRMELEIGLYQYGDAVIPMISPVGIPRNVETKLVRIAPGDTKRLSVARRIAEILAVDVEEIESILPPGNSRLLEP
jgi:predicted ribosome quality control (RQC) complex YloA/Tae2 family protein